MKPSSVCSPALTRSDCPLVPHFVSPKPANTYRHSKHLFPKHLRPAHRERERFPENRTSLSISNLQNSLGSGPLVSIPRRSTFRLILLKKPVIPHIPPNSTSVSQPLSQPVDFTNFTSFDRLHPFSLHPSAFILFSEKPRHFAYFAKFLFPLFLFLFGVLPLVLPAHAGDWPHFLGPDANGTSIETNLISSFPADGPPLVWEKDIGTGYSAPSIRDGKLILHHRLKNEEIVEAFNPADGKPIWRYAYPTSFVDPYGYNNGPRCTPLLTSNRCYTFGADGVLLCLDLANGKPVWHRDTQKQWEVPEAFFGVGSTPILEGGRLIVMIGGQPNSGVAALDPATGKTLWESVGEKNWQGQPMIGWPGERTIDWKRFRQDKQASYATPVAATVNGQRQVFCLMRQGLVSLNPTNGAVNFSYFFRAQVDESVNAANPVVLDDQVFISTAYYRVGSTLLKILPDNKSVEPVWRNTSLEIHWTTPILHEGYLYAFSGRNEPDARFRCVEYKTGKVMWDRDERWRRYGQTLGTYGRGSAIRADGKLIVLGEAGLLGLFRINPNKDEELGRHQLPQLKYPCWAAPILSERRVYLRSENKLLCLDFAKK